MIKTAECRATPSIQRCVVLPQDGVARMMLSHRHGDWVTDTLVGPAAMLAMPEIGIEIPLSEISEDVVFPGTVED